MPKPPVVCHAAVSLRFQDLKCIGYLLLSNKQPPSVDLLTVLQFRQSWVGTGGPLVYWCCVGWGGPTGLPHMSGALGGVAEWLGAGPPPFVVSSASLLGGGR